MDDLIGFLCGASILTALVAAIGHGIWVFVAWLFRMLTGTSANSVPRTRCDVCQSPRSVEQGRCRVCGAVAPQGGLLNERADVLATRRQLQRWTERGKLADEEFQRLNALCALPEDSPAAASAATVAPSPFATTSPASRTAGPAPEVTEHAAAASEVPAAPVAGPAEATGSVGGASDVEIVTAEIVDDLVAEVHPLDRAEAPVAPKPPSAPRRALADVLQAFMEQKNIRWIELISGLLIVGCATGLVISLRAALRDKIPYFPALSFMLVTGAFHAAGLYSLRRWNLKTTSRGVLVIATLLVPLSILAAIFLSGEGESQRPVSDPVFLLAVIVGVLSFTTMNYFASRALVRRGWWRLMVAVLGASFAQILVDRATYEPGARFAAWPVIPALLAYGVANLALLRHARRHSVLGRRGCQQLFLELGLGTFALLAPIGLFVARAETTAAAARDLSPLASLGAAVLLAAGLLVHRRVTQTSLIGYRTAGTAIAVLGGSLMLLFVGFAWPDVRMLIAVGCFNFVTLLALAVAGELALLHGLAALSLAVGYLGMYLAWRGVPTIAAPGVAGELLRTVLQSQTAVALSLFATVAAIVGAITGRRDRPIGWAYFAASAAIAVVCVGIAFYSGYWINHAEGNLATAVFLYFAVASLIVAWVLGRSEAAWSGASLLLAGTIHGLAMNDWVADRLADAGMILRHPLLVGFLSHSVVMALLAAVASWRGMSGSAAEEPADQLGDVPQKRPRSDRQASFTIPLSWSALATSLVVIPLALLVREPAYRDQAAYLGAASIAWLVAFSVHPRTWVCNGFQIVATLAVAYLTTSFAATRDWWTGSLADARHIQLQIAVLGATCLGWMAYRAAWRQQAITPSRFPSHSLQTFDQFLLAGLVVAVNAIAAFACAPGVWSELGIGQAFGSAPAAVRDPGVENLLRFVGMGSWLAWGVVLLATVAALGECRAASRMLLIVLASAAAPALMAGRFFEQNATATALRWMFAGFCLLWFLPAGWLGGARRVSPDGWLVDVWRCYRPADVIRRTSVSLSSAVILGLTTIILMRVANRLGVATPIAESFFGRMSSAVSYAVPLGVLATVLFAYALREAKPRWALAASAVFQYFISLACLLPTLAAGRVIDSEVFASLVQWNLVGLAAFSLLWVSCRRWIEPTDTGESVARHLPLAVQLGLLIAVAISASAWITVEIWSDPLGQSGAIDIWGTWPSYLALALGTAVGAWLARQDSKQIESVIFGVSILMVPLLAAALHRHDLSGQWWAFHTLVGGWAVVAAGAVAWMYRDLRSYPLTATRQEMAGTTRGMTWGVLATVLASLSALTNIDDAPSVLVEIVAACGVVILAGATAIRLRMQRFTYASLFYAGVTALLVYEELPVGARLRNELSQMGMLAFALLATAVVILMAEVWFQRRGEPGISRRGVGAAHRFAGWASIVWGVLLLAIMSLTILAWRKPLSLRPAELTLWIGVLIMFFTLHAGLLWDRRGHYGPLGLYIWLGLVSLFVVIQLPLDPSARVVSWIGALASQVALTGWIWSWGGKLAALGLRYGMCDPIESLRRTSGWLVGANLLLTVQSVIASSWVVLAMERRDLRVIAASLPLLLAGGVAGIAQQHRRIALQISALLLVAWSAVLLGWSDIPPEFSEANTIARAIRLLMACCVGAFALGVIAVRVVPSESTWRTAARHATLLLVVGAGVALGATLVLEAITFQPGIGAPVSPAQIAAVSLVLVALIATLISLAVLPGRDPLGLTERGRMGYVYAAQATAALLFAHIYLAMPTLFQGYFRPYWPYVVLAIAFAGVGVGTIFERLGWRVLAEPFQRSGAFLPLLPAIGMWFVQSNSQYASVLLVIGLLYLALSFAQKSVWTRAAATIAGNGALWSFLSGNEDLTFGEHPQFWLIPPAVSVLVAAQVQRRHLGATELAAIRYASMIVIYVSSTIEMLIVGIGESLWPPVILICLSLVGVAFGIAMRIRAYLYLGAAFVLVSLVSMVAHASRSIQHVWPWWAFGIAMGVVILTVFGYFESRRTQMLAWIERLRQWEK